MGGIEENARFKQEMLASMTERNGGNNALRGVPLMGALPRQVAFGGRDDASGSPIDAQQLVQGHDADVRHRQGRLSVDRLGHGSQRVGIEAGYIDPLPHGWNEASPCLPTEIDRIGSP